MSRELTDADYEIARRVARRFKGNRVFKGMDVDDIAQEMALRLSRVMHRFNPARGAWEAFAMAVMTREGNRQIRLRNRKNEKWWRENTTTLDAQIGEGENGDPIFLVDMIGGAEPPLDREAGYRVDRESALARLTTEQREAAGHMEHGTKSVVEMAREMGMPRTTFRERIAAPALRMLLSVV